MHPVLQDMELRARRKGHMDVGMVMAEDEMIDLAGRRKILGKLIQRLFFSPENIFLIVGQTVVLRPSVAEAEGKPRMKRTEKDLEETAMEHSAEEAVI